MLGRRRLGWALRLLGVDAATLAGSFLVAYGLRTVLGQPFGRPTSALGVNLWLLGLMLPVWLVLLAACGGYGVRWLDRSRASLALRVSGLGLVVLMAGFFVTREREIYRSLLVLFAATSAVTLAVERRLVQAWLLKRRRDARWLRHALVVGTPDRVRRLVAALEQYPETGWSVLGWVSLDPGEAASDVGGTPLAARLADFADYLQQDRVVDEVFFTVPPSELDRLADALQACEHLGVDTRVVVDFYQPARARPFVEELFGYPVFGFSLTPGWQGALAVKRLVDIAGAGLGLLVLLPVLIGLGLLVRATSPGPALFRQQRAGLRGRRFTIYKFRTMVRDAEQRRLDVADLNEMAEPVFKLRSDPRVTALGRVLRRASLDELPQLWNVLRGDMSLVGPRPLPMHEANRIKGAQRRRLAMRPGITGLWQVSGRTLVDFDEWMRLDLAYVDGWSLGLDLTILLRTAVAVASGRGAY